MLAISRPIRPNLHTPNKGTSGSIAIAAAALQRLLYPVGDTTHDALSFFRVVVDQRNVYLTISAIRYGWIRLKILKKHLPEIWLGHVRTTKYG